MYKTYSVKEMSKNGIVVNLNNITLFKVGISSVFIL